MARYPNLNAEMRRYGITQAMIAERIGKAEVTVHNWLSGKSSIPIASCFAIRDGFFDGLSLDYLFSDTPTNVRQ